MNETIGKPTMLAETTPIPAMQTLQNVRRASLTGCAGGESDSTCVF
jgi:hypothetical protein